VPNPDLSRSAAALIPAAGRGERLGRGPKALLELGGRPLLAVAAAPFFRLGMPVVVAAPHELLEEVRRAVPAARVVAGGESRQATVLRLLEGADAEVVLVHDAARPFLPVGVLRAVLAAARETGAATAAQPVADTLVRAGTGEGVARDGLMAVQTPQGFRRDVLLEAHRRAALEGALATDDAGLVRRLGQPVALVPGSPWLMKITTPDDYRLAQCLAACWEAGRAP
jgi:2-C-methyl-D-erythritol 4-phosphate cytidylyltransferase